MTDKESFVFVGEVIFFILLIQVIGGCSGKLWREGCKEPPARIEYVFFGYQLGCWMGGN